MLHFFKSFFPGREETDDPTDIPAIIEQVKQRERRQEIPLGRRIHSFSHLHFQLSLDRDITENYRLTVYQGRERIYSFTIFADQGNYSILENAYAKVISFLNSDRKIGDLPDDDHLKGFFYGY